MQHPTDIERHTVIAADAAEVGGIRVEKLGHAERPQHVRKLRAVRAVKLRQARNHRRALRSGQHRAQTLAAEAGDVFVKPDSSFRKQRGKGVTPALIIFDEACGAAVGDIGVLLGVHEIDQSVLAIGVGEAPLLDLIGGIHRLPLCVKGDGVYQVQHRVVGDLVQYPVYHPAGIFLHPRIDAVERPAVERCGEHGAVVISGVLLNERVVYLQLVVVPQPHGAGRAKLAALAVIQRRQKRRHIRVQLVRAHTEQVFKLAERFALGTVGSHGQRAEYRGRGNQRVAVGWAAFQQAQRQLRDRRVRLLRQRGGVGGDLIGVFGRDLAHGGASAAAKQHRHGQQQA